jgi:hypothetical protein
VWGHVARYGRCEKQCSGYIRIFDDGQGYGDKYRYVFPFHMVAEDAIELGGIGGKGQRPPTAAELRAALRACKEAGLKVLRERKAGRRRGVREITRHGF